MINKLIHDKILSSKTTLRLENRLKREIQLYLNHTLIPSLRSREDIDPIKLNNIITRYSDASYRLGAHYSSKIANNELVFSDNDIKIKKDLINYFIETFWNKIKGLASIQRIDRHLKPSKVVSMEKERLSSELSTLIAWKSFNTGIISKGQQLKENILSADKTGLVGINRKIWKKDFSGTYKQKLITDRIPTLERTSAVKKVEKRLHVSQIPESFPDEFGPKFMIVWTFVTMNDELVCEICRDFETQQWQLDDPTIPEIPDDTHPNCRCRMAFAEILED